MQELSQLIEEANHTLEESHEVVVVILHRDNPGGSIGITLAGGADYEAKEITVSTGINAAHHTNCHQIARGEENFLVPLGRKVSLTVLGSYIAEAIRDGSPNQPQIKYLQGCLRRDSFILMREGLVKGRRRQEVEINNTLSLMIN